MYEQIMLHSFDSMLPLRLYIYFFKWQTENFENLPAADSNENVINKMPINHQI